VIHLYKKDSATPVCGAMTCHLPHEERGLTEMVVSERCGRCGDWQYARGKYLQRIEKSGIPNASKAKKRRKR
jgi:hypothetical protein